MNESLTRLYELDNEILVLSHISAILAWDQETYMPPKAVGERGDQLAAMEGIAHNKLTGREMGDLFDKLGADDESYLKNDSLTQKDKALIKKLYKRYLREVKLPESLVKEFAKTAAEAQAAWVKARSDSDFPRFAPYLQKLLDLSMEKGGLYGCPDNPYAPLVDEYEPYATVEEIDSIFDTLENGLVPLIKEISEAEQVDDSFLLKNYDVDAQEKFGRFVLSKLNFEQERGRMDVSAHPFTTTLGRDDVRITTHYKLDFFKSSIFGTIHECGHALYELGFGGELYGSSLADCASLGIHESQSRTWENIIGRSRSFWKYFYPALQSHFPGVLDGIDLEKFYKGVNKVEPSLIRIEADEATYSLHVILRFRLEKALFAGEIKVNDLPAAWNDLMYKLLGVRPANDAEGVLQDVHWSFGGFGYFPTYAIGNMYGAQFYSKMEKDIPALDSEISEGNMAPALGWMRENIHKAGSLYSAGELCEKITGAKLDPKYFLNYLRGKFTDIYGL